MRRWWSLVCGVSLALSLVACSSGGPSQVGGADGRLPTPSVGILRANDAGAADARLRVTLPSVKLLRDENSGEVQLLLALADPAGPVSYLLYPANRTGEEAGQFDLSQAPLELGLTDESQTAKLWVLALHNQHYAATERYGVEQLAADLAEGFNEWLRAGDPLDDPLAGVVSASDGALLDWFGAVDVVGQDVITLRAVDGWNIGLASQHSDDGALNTVYTVQYIMQNPPTRIVATPVPTPSPEPTPTEPEPGAVLVDETFAGGVSQSAWYQGEDDTFVNHIVDGAYEIRLTDITQRDYALSWGSLEAAHFENYRVEAEVSLVDGDAANARYGIWLNYQDDYNFLYFGVSGAGEYRAAVVLRNANRIEFQDWTPHEAVHPAEATNSLTADVRSNGDVTLGINGTEVARFNDRTFSGGSIAFFCYAESVPTTCRLEHLRVTQLSR